MRIGLDLDGTLISCREKHCALMGSICKAFGIELNIAQYWQHKRQGFNNDRALREQGIEDSVVDQMGIHWSDLIENMEWLFFDQVFSGVAAKLQSLKEAQHSLHLVSARRIAETGFLHLKTLGLLHFFDSVDFVNARRGEKKLFAFQKHNFDLYIGDVETDYFISQEASVRFLGVASGMRDRDFLERLNISVYDSFVQIAIE